MRSHLKNEFKKLDYSRTNLLSEVLKIVSNIDVKKLLHDQPNQQAREVVRQNRLQLINKYNRAFRGYMTESKVVLVTGAAKRIGASIARIFHGNGYRILIHAKTQCLKQKTFVLNSTE